MCIRDRYQRRVRGFQKKIRKLLVTTMGGDEHYIPFKQRTVSRVWLKNPIAWPIYAIGVLGSIVLTYYSYKAVFLNNHVVWNRKKLQPYVREGHTKALSRDLLSERYNAKISPYEKRDY
eukprot:TRINITY_DN3914_c0_g1_i6.p1 TRINITY_DN3914_c0_g1~~TRINITY_DN3914_c0_g1_i6.p1  ORF type:complete len:119 (+),score=26.91 TRINITY_DN3914_c0_g1_i6:3-359(+)